MLLGVTVKRTIDSHDVSPELLVLCGVDEMEGVDS